MNKKLSEYVVSHKEKIDQAIEFELEKRLLEVKEISPHLIKVVEAMKELSVGGKRLRGLLTILGYEMAGGVASPEIYKAAAVMELFHLGLLIQDDVMDRDDLRRGVKTIHHRYNDLHLGESIAICAGDVPYGWGMEIIAGLELDKNNLNNAIKVWGKYFYRVGYGQILDVLSDQRGNTSDEEVLKVLMIKSGEYTCVLPLLLGATLAGATQELKYNLYKFGMELGWVFQLRDDWLAEYGDTAKTGKPVGGDSREGKRTFVTMYGKEKSEAAISEHMKAANDVLRNFKGVSLKVMEGLVEWMGTREN